MHARNLSIFFLILPLLMLSGCDRSAYEAKERSDTRHRLKKLGEFISDHHSDKDKLVTIAQAGATQLGFGEDVKEAAVEPIAANCFIVLRDSTRDLPADCPIIYYILKPNSGALLDVLILDCGESVWYRRVSEAELRSNLIKVTDCSKARAWVRALVLDDQATTE